MVSHTDDQGNGDELDDEDWNDVDKIQRCATPAVRRSILREFGGSKTTSRGNATMEANGYVRGTRKAMKGAGMKASGMLEGW